jgi:hypothetical protein
MLFMGSKKALNNVKREGIWKGRNCSRPFEKREKYICEDYKLQ